jgi:hypothetical protein
MNECRKFIPTLELLQESPSVIFYSGKINSVLQSSTNLTSQKVIFQDNWYRMELEWTLRQVKFTRRRAKFKSNLLSLRTYFYLSKFQNTTSFLLVAIQIWIDILHGKKDDFYAWFFFIIVGSWKSWYRISANSFLPWIVSSLQ